MSSNSPVSDSIKSADTQCILSYISLLFRFETPVESVKCSATAVIRETGKIYPYHKKTETNTNGSSLASFPGIQVCFVRPFPDLRHLSVGEIIPEGVMSFYKVNEVDLFKCDRPFHRGPRDEGNEFKVRRALLSLLICASARDAQLYGFQFPGAWNKARKTVLRDTMSGILEQCSSTE